jgi:hypothetical protein
MIENALILSGVVTYSRGTSSKSGREFANVQVDFLGGSKQIGAEPEKLNEFAARVKPGEKGTVIARLTVNRFGERFDVVSVQPEGADLAKLLAGK